MTPLPFILTRGSDSCRNVSYPNRTLRGVNMLATSSPSSKSLDFEIRLINLDTGWCITQDRYDGHCCKWSMSALSTIKWWTTNQSVDSYFCFGITVCIFTIHFDCRPLKKDEFNVNQVDEYLSRDDEGKKVWNSSFKCRKHMKRALTHKREKYVFAFRF